MLIVLSVL